jgi:hypothetical protein
VRELQARDDRLRQAEDELARLAAELHSLPGLAALLGPSRGDPSSPQPRAPPSSTWPPARSAGSRW